MATRKKTLPKGGCSGTKSPRQLMLKDLKGSGLTTDDAKKLGFEVLSRDETKELTNFDCESYLIPYYTINGKLTDGWRVRYLEEIRGPFSAIKKKPPRYSREKKRYRVSTFRKMFPRWPATKKHKNAAQRIQGQTLQTG